jgi:ACT domain-containing protein
MALVAMMLSVFVLATCSVDHLCHLEVVMKKMIITVVGKDTVGILHKVSGICAGHNVNVIEVTQSVLQDMFAMIMMVDISGMSSDFSALSDEMTELGKSEGLAIHCMHEDIFNSMHKI